MVVREQVAARQALAALRALAEQPGRAAVVRAARRAALRV